MSRWSGGWYHFKPFRGLLCGKWVAPSGACATFVLGLTFSPPVASFLTLQAWFTGLASLYGRDGLQVEDMPWDAK